MAMSSRSAAAAGSETQISSGSRKKTTTTVYKSDGSGNVTKESHVDIQGSSSSDVHVMAMRRMEEKIRDGRRNSIENSFATFLLCHK
jgi:hypothetical protein